MKIFHAIAMEFFELFERSGVALIVGVIVSTLVAMLFFIAKQALKDPQRKYLKDKALLKELLEELGLDIPAELNDSEGRILKSIKKS